MRSFSSEIQINEAIYKHYLKVAKDPNKTLNKAFEAEIIN